MKVRRTFLVGRLSHLILVLLLLLCSSEYSMGKKIGGTNLWTKTTRASVPSKSSVAKYPLESVSNQANPDLISGSRQLLSTYLGQLSESFNELKNAEDKYRRVNVALALVGRHYVVSSSLLFIAFRALGKVMVHPEDAGLDMIRKLHEQESAKWGRL